MIDRIEYKTRKGKYLNQIKWHYTNGKSSPMIKGRENDGLSELITLKFNDIKNVRHIEGTIRANLNVKHLIFKKDD